MSMAMAGVSIVNSSLSLSRAPHAYRLVSLPLFSSIPKSVCFQHLPRARHAEKSHAVPACRSGLGLFISWEACSHLGWTFELKAIQKKDFRRQRKCRVAQASLFGVGAPEALVIGVVALLVFGPKGLAEVARTLGKSLRAFQPTIKELQEVSREFKNTLEQEIGLDELRSSTVDSPKSASQSPQRQTIEEQNGPPARKAYSTEDYLRITEEEIKALTPKEQPKGSDVDAMNNAHPSTAKAGSDVTDLSPKQNGSKEVKANDDNVV